MISVLENEAFQRVRCEKGRCKREMCSQSAMREWSVSAVRASEVCSSERSTQGDDMKLFSRSEGFHLHTCRTRVHLVASSNHDRPDPLPHLLRV